MTQQREHQEDPEQVHNVEESDGHGHVHGNHRNGNRALVWEWHPVLVTKRRIRAEQETAMSVDNALGGPTARRKCRPQSRLEQSDYRTLPLQPRDDDYLIPNTQIENIADAIPIAIERERLIETNVLPLMCGKRIWNYRDDLDYTNAHPNEAMLRVTPEDWLKSNPDDDDMQYPWPNGCPYESSVFRLCWSFYVFVYRKNKAASIKVILCQVFNAFIPPTCSYLFGTGLIDELSSKTRDRQSDKERFAYASLYVIAIMVLQILGSYIHLYYSKSIPSGATRTALRDMVFRKVQNLQNPQLKHKLTPGAVSGIVLDKVYNAVSIYSSFLTFPVRHTS
jgi:hypothetical protein